MRDRARRTVVVVAVALVAGVAAASGATPVRWIVFSAQPDGTAPPQLYRVQTNGEGLQQITTGDKPATDPDFSPDGRRIAFARLGSGIFRVDLDGSGLQRLTSGARDTYPVWSPDAKRIAFVRVYKASWRVYVMAASGKGQHRLTHAPPAGRPTWTKDGKSIFIPAAADIVKIDARTGTVQKRFGLTLDPSVSQAATVSPDSRTFAFVGRRAPTGPPDCGESHCPAFALYVADSSKRKPRRIANDTGPAGWSPDGKSLAFVASGTLTLAPAGGGTKTRIPSGTHVAQGDAPPSWQPR